MKKALIWTFFFQDLHAKGDKPKIKELFMAYYKISLIRKIIKRTGICWQTTAEGKSVRNMSGDFVFWGIFATFNLSLQFSENPILKPFSVNVDYKQLIENGSKYTGSTICSETLYFVDCESADWRSEKFLGSNERYIY